MEQEIEEIKWKLKKYNQEHLLNSYEELPENKQKELIDQLKEIDFELIDNLYRNTTKEVDLSNSQIEPIEYLDKYKLNEKFKEYETIGKKSISEGKLAAVTMAGGQGTRLGHNGPKGTYDIGLDSHKS